jgi:hypothetical protein
VTAGARRSAATLILQVIENQRHSHTRPFSHLPAPSSGAFVAHRTCAFEMSPWLAWRYFKYRAAALRAFVQASEFGRTVECSVGTLNETRGGRPPVAVRPPETMED